MNVAIVCDSTAVMDKAFIDSNDNLYTVPLQILIGDSVYKDGIDLTQEQFFQKMDSTTVIPTTSQPSVGAVLELFEKLKERYTQILYITISSKISGTYSTGRLAAGQVEGVQVEVLDSLNTSVIQHMMTQEAVNLSNQGLGLDEIVAELNVMKENSNIFLIVDDLKHLGRTGRVNNLSAIVGALLKIKPILHFENGYINLYKKIRTLNKAYLEVIEIVRDLNLSDNATVMIAHANGYSNALKVQRALKELLPNKEIQIIELSPVISVHTGPNSVGIGWINKE